MGMLDDFGNLAKQFASGNASASDVHAAYDQVAQGLPQGVLTDGISHAFRSDETPPFERR